MFLAESLKGLVKPSFDNPFGDISMVNLVKKFGVKTAVVTGALVTSASSFAADHSAAINAAVTEGQANYTLVVVGLIGLAAIGFGLHMMISSMRS